MIDPNKRFFELTVAEIRELFASLGSFAQPVAEPVQEPVEYGIAGIARIFNCSTRQASRIKESGKIAEAIRQNGRIIEININKAKELFYNSSQQ